MRAYKQHVLVLCVKCKRPNTLARQASLFRVNTSPGNTAIHRAKDTATDLTCLVSIPHKDFVAIAGIDQNTGEIAERKIATAPTPAHAPIMRQIKGLLRSYVDAVGFLWILGNSIYGCILRNSFDLPPTCTTVACNEHAGRGSAHPDCFWVFQTR